MARKLGLAGKVRVGLVTGDDILDRLDELIARGHALADMETGRPLADIRDRCSRPTPTSAWRRSSRRFAAARTSSSPAASPTPVSRSGPIFHEFGWSPEDWDKVAAGTVAGHIIECGAQASGGNLLQGLALGEGNGRIPAFPSWRPRPTAASS